MNGVSYPARKIGGTYQADGWVVAEFYNRKGEKRVVFEFKDIPGMLHIFMPFQVQLRDIEP